MHAVILCMLQSFHSAVLSGCYEAVPAVYDFVLENLELGKCRNIKVSMAHVHLLTLQVSADFCGHHMPLN